MTCSKIPYSTKAQAKRAGRQRDAQRSSKGEDPRPVDSYRCRDCGAWHNGHSRGRMPCRDCGRSIILAPWRPGGLDMPTDAVTGNQHTRAACRHVRMVDGIA